MASDTLPDKLSGSVTEAADPGRRRGARLIGVAAVLAMALRLPFLFTGLSTDEGGYAYVVQQWARGGKIYTSDWIDRPQGLLLTYRFVLWLNDSGWTIRLGMMLAGAIITACLGVIGWHLAGRRAGVTAAFLYAVIGVAPHLEGITLNGELLASVPATASIAAAVAWRYSIARDDRRLRGRWLLALAGLLAGVALTMKQSGIDGLLVGVAMIIAVGGGWRARLARLGGFGAAFAVPVGACVIHGIVIGWSAYWNALFGYQLSAIANGTGASDSRWQDFARYAPSVAIDLGALIVVGVIGFRFFGRLGRVTLATWLVAAVIGINLGGSYWPHYYMQILPPLVLLAAGAAAAIEFTWVRRALATVLVAPTLVWLAVLVPMSQHDREQAVPYYALAARNEQLAAAIDDSTTPEQKIYVMWASPYIYFLAQRQAPYPYLWGKPIQKIAAAVPLMRSMLESPDRPTLVIMDQPSTIAIDPSGGVMEALTAYYHLDRVVDGVTILRAD